MTITKPDYFDRFQCIADRCPDSCCHEWDVQVDADSAARFRKMEGPLGDALREHLYEEDGETYLAAIEDDDEFNEVGNLFEERLEDLFELEDEE